MIKKEVLKTKPEEAKLGFSLRSIKNKINELVEKVSSIDILKINNIGWYDARKYATDSLRRKNGLAGAMNEIGSANKTVLVTNQQDIPASITVPSNITLQFLQGGILNIDSGKTVTINGHVEAGLYQIFEGDGSVSFGSGSVKEVYSQWWGAKGDGATDDAPAIQAAVTSLTNGGTIFFPRPASSYLINSRITINTAGIAIRGDGDYNTILMFNDCSGFLIDKVSYVQFKNIEIKQVIRYTTTPNSHIGIDVDGLTGTRPTNHVYRDVYIDGFETGIETNYLWSSVFDNVSIGNGHIGIEVKGLSVNNVITNSSIGVDDGAGGSYGIKLGDGANIVEGWIITNTLINAAEFGILGTDASHITVANNIIDHSYSSGIYIYDGSTRPSNGWRIISNYIAMSGGSGVAGIKLSQSIADAQINGNQVSTNTIFTYSGATCSYGIQLLGTEAKNSIMDGNYIKGIATGDIRSERKEVTIVNNICLSTAPTENIYSNTGGLIANNIGTVYATNNTVYSKVGLIKITYGQASPTSEVWNKGDIVFQRIPTAGATPGWVCVNRTDTQIRVGASSTDTTIEVDSTTGMTAGDIIGIDTDDGTTHWSTIDTVTDGDTLVIDDALDDDAAIDKDVYTNLWKAMANLAA